MLRIDIPGQEFFSEEEQRFITVPGVSVQMEHSLVSVSKWESKWHKPFLKNEQKTPEELIDYIRCMIIRPKLDDDAFTILCNTHFQQIMSYIEDSMTATWFNDREQKRHSREIVTSEVIYYWMTALGIPFECERWHLNRLLTLIHVCNNKNTPPKKMGKKNTMQHNRALNQARRNKMGSRG